MPKKNRKPLQDLKSYDQPYVTIAELANYWLVSRKQIYKQIEAGTLPAIRLGPRLLRILTSDAIEFERSANLRPPAYRTSVSGPAKRSFSVRGRSRRR